MRASLAFSAVGHVALLLWGMVLFAGPKQFAPVPPESIMVDIVPATTMGQEAASPSAERAAAQQSRPDPPQPGLDPKQESAAAAQPPAPQPRTEARGPDPARPPAAEPPPPPEAEPAPNLLVFNPTVDPVQEVPLPTGGVQNPTGGFDAPAQSSAALSGDEIAALKAHLQKCWNPPPAIAEAVKLRVVLRVALTPGGTITGSPMLIEASASAHGPALVAAATSALKQCQPYSFLPAGKYQEWKLLDLSFTPRGLTGG